MKEQPQNPYIDEALMSGMNEFSPSENQKFVEDHNVDIKDDEVNGDEDFNDFEANLINVTNSLSTMLEQIEKLKFEVADLKRQKEELDNDERKMNENGGVDNLDELEIFLSSDKYKVNLMEYYTILKDEGFDDMDILKELTDEGLKGIGIVKLAHRMKILRGIKLLNT